MQRRLKQAENPEPYQLPGEMAHLSFVGVVLVGILQVSEQAQLHVLGSRFEVPSSGSGVGFGASERGEEA